MPHLPAAILILVDRPFPDRQERVALAHAVAQGFDPTCLCRSLDAAMALVLVGAVVAVVCALDPRDGGAIEKAGAQLLVVRREDHRKRRSLARLIERLAGTGLDVKKIAQVLEVDSGEVRRLLGQRRRSGPNNGAE